jgi:hypothetical protein
VVTVTLNGNVHRHHGGGRHWSLTVPAADLAGLGQANYTLSATATNGVGNSVSNTANLLVDTALPTVTINTVAGDNVINAAEVAAGQTISGSSERGSGQHRDRDHWRQQLHRNGAERSDLVRERAGIRPDGAGQRRFDGVSDRHQRPRQHRNGRARNRYDASLPGLRVDTVAGDDVINSIEHGRT